MFQPPNAYCSKQAILRSYVCPSHECATHSMMPDQCLCCTVQSRSLLRFLWENAISCSDSATHMDGTRSVVNNVDPPAFPSDAPDPPHSSRAGKFPFFYQFCAHQCQKCVSLNLHCFKAWSKQGIAANYSGPIKRHSHTSQSIKNVVQQFRLFIVMSLEIDPTWQWHRAKRMFTRVNLFSIFLNFYAHAIRLCERVCVWCVWPTGNDQLNNIELWLRVACQRHQNWINPGEHIAHQCCIDGNRGALSRN